MIVYTNDGSVVRRFDEAGREYVVDNRFTAQWRYTQSVFDRAKEAIDAIVGDEEVTIRAPDPRPGHEGQTWERTIRGLGLDYEEFDSKGNGVFDREKTQIAFKLEASPEKRMEYAQQVETLLNDHVFKKEGVRFKAEISGKSTISLMIVSSGPRGPASFQSRQERSAENYLQSLSRLGPQRTQA